MSLFLILKTLHVIGAMVLLGTGAMGLVGAARRRFNR